MKMPFVIRATVLAFAALTGVTLSSAAHADEGFVQLTIYKAGWVIGGSGGNGVLNFRGRRYPLSTGGLDYGFVFGGSTGPLRLLNEALGGQAGWFLGFAAVAAIALAVSTRLRRNVS